MSRHVLSTGVVIDDEKGSAATLNRYAARLKLDDVRVWHATHPNGTEVYMISEGTQAVFENTSMEAIGTRLDMMGLLRATRNKG